MGDEDKAVWQAELADLDNEIASVIRQAVSSRSSNDKSNPLLDVAAALIEKDRVCSNTGLARALRELSLTTPRQMIHRRGLPSSFVSIDRSIRQSNTKKVSWMD